jgi:hypothetical protein
VEEMRVGGWAGWRRGKDFIFRNYFKCENNSRKSRNCFEGMKNTQIILKIPGKFQEID